MSESRLQILLISVYRYLHGTSWELCDEDLLNGNGWSLLARRTNFYRRHFVIRDGKSTSARVYGVKQGPISHFAYRAIIGLPL